MAGCRPSPCTPGAQPQSPYPPVAHCPPPSSPCSKPSTVVFPPGTDPKAVACFQLCDTDNDGIINDKDLIKGLSVYYNHNFQSRTAHFLMAVYTNWSKVKKIGPKEFVPMFHALQEWKIIFEKFDVDRSGKIEHAELANALMSLGYGVPPSVLERLMSKFGKGPTKAQKAIDYSYFIECCLTVKGLTDAFKAKDTALCGSVNLGYECFMMTVLPFMAV